MRVCAPQPSQMSNFFNLPALLLLLFLPPQLRVSGCSHPNHPTACSRRTKRCRWPRSSGWAPLNLKTTGDRAWLSPCLSQDPLPCAMDEVVKVETLQRVAVSKNARHSKGGQWLRFLVNTCDFREHVMLRLSEYSWICPLRQHQRPSALPAAVSCNFCTFASYLNLRSANAASSSSGPSPVNG